MSACVQFSTYNSGVEILGTKKTVKVGDRVKLTEMNDTWSKLEKGSEGTVSKIEEDQDLIWVKWDNGEKLALLEGIDKFKVVKD